MVFHLPFLFRFIVGNREMLWVHVTTYSSSECPLLVYIPVIEMQRGREQLHMRPILKCFPCINILLILKACILNTRLQRWYLLQLSSVLFYV